MILLPGRVIVCVGGCTVIAARLFVVVCGWHASCLMVSVDSDFVFVDVGRHLRTRRVHDDSVII